LYSNGHYTFISYAENTSPHLGVYYNGKKLLLRTDANLNKDAIQTNSGWTLSSRGVIDCFSRQHAPDF